MCDSVLRHDDFLDDIFNIQDLSSVNLLSKTNDFYKTDKVVNKTHDFTKTNKFVNENI